MWIQCVQCCVVEVELVYCVVFEVFVEDICCCDELLYDFQFVWVFYVDCEIFFVVVEYFEEVCVGIVQCLCVVVCDWFDFDYFCVEICEQYFVCWIYYYVCYFDYVYVCIWQCGSLLLIVYCVIFVMYFFGCGVIVV